MKYGAHSKRWYLAFVVLAGCASFALAFSNRMTFPFPCVDDAIFYLPGLWWAEHLSLEPTFLHAPGGIFWLPDGFTVFIGLAASLFGHTIEVARATCECTVALGVMLFSLAFRKLAGSPEMGVAATLWLLTPPVVYAANEVRMEAPVFLLIAVALVLHLNGYVLAAASLLFGGLLFHPILGLAAVGYAFTAWGAGGEARLNRRPTLAEWIVFVVVAIGLSAEALRVLHHLDLFNAHMAFQLARKRGIPLHRKLAKPQGAILFACLAAIAALLWRRHTDRMVGRVRDVLPLATIALGVLTSAALGAEPMYDVYSLSLGPALVFCLVCRDFYRARSQVSRSPERVELLRRPESHSAPTVFS